VTRRAIFLDRDGVLNRAITRNGMPHPPDTPGDVEILPGVASALERLKQAGFLLVGITNQPDVARGRVSREVVQAINASLLAALPLEDILVCYHDDADGCRCRKPQPGLLIEASLRFGIHVASSFMVGDRWRDIEAGRAAGCRTVFIDCAYAEPAPAGADHVSGSLPEAAEWILSVADSARQAAPR
jgi:D-glycero-D-manno-heptose 1,7-bisphosphate phosphatase